MCELKCSSVYNIIALYHIMSIATLKKKTFTQYHNMSANKQFASPLGFSLNGTHRSQGWVGQTTLSRSLPKTPMRGNVACGHGGCCGTFNVGTIVQSAVLSKNDNNIAKTSNMNTLALIETKYMWAKRPQPYSSWKPDTNNNINTGNQYIVNLRKKTITQMLDASCNIIDPDKQAQLMDQSCIDSRNYNKKLTHGCINITKPESEYVAMSAGEYLLRLHTKCTDNDIVSFPSGNKRSPFGCPNPTPI